MSNQGDRISQLLEEFKRSRDVMVGELSKVVIGQSDVIELILASIFTRGHVLLVGVPGLAKTLMVSSLAKILDVGFKRIQFTPDLMPSDITGTNVLEEPESGRRSFRFIQGPLFSNIILADEINRTPPKTQAALLQAMQEREVTVGQETMKLPEPFFVIATQNPIEQEGTYPLPEAQLDRFHFKLVVGYSNRDELNEILNRTTRGVSATIERVIDGDTLIDHQATVRQVLIASHVQDYAVRLVLATHPGGPFATDATNRFIRWGSSPRGAQTMVLTSKAAAILDNRFNVSFEDVRRSLLPSLRHRVLLNFEAQAEGKDVDQILLDILKSVPEMPEKASVKSA